MARCFANSTCGSSQTAVSSKECASGRHGGVYAPTPSQERREYFSHFCLFAPVHRHPRAQKGACEERVVCVWDWGGPFGNSFFLDIQRVLRECTRCVCNSPSGEGLHPCFYETLMRRIFSFFVIYSSCIYSFFMVWQFTES